MEKVKNELSIHPIIAPAIVADNSDTTVPANIALKPSSINICLLYTSDAADE